MAKRSTLLVRRKSCMIAGLFMSSEIAAADLVLQWVKLRQWVEEVGPGLRLTSPARRRRSGRNTRLRKGNEEGKVDCVETRGKHRCESMREVGEMVKGRWSSGGNRDEAMGK
jgi:hypothetical protein